MKMENHVPSLELCKRWKEVGGRQDTNFSFGWSGYEYDPLFSLGFTEDLQDSKEIVAAPLASELMEWLPDLIYQDGDEYTFEVIRDYQLGQDSPTPNDLFWYINYRKVGYEIWCAKTTYDKSLPNALMQMAIWEKERK